MYVLGFKRKEKVVKNVWKEKNEQKRKKRKEKEFEKEKK